MQGGKEGERDRGREGRRECFVTEERWERVGGDRKEGKEG